MEQTFFDIDLGYQIIIEHCQHEVLLEIIKDKFYQEFILHDVLEIFELTVCNIPVLVVNTKKETWSITQQNIIIINKTNPNIIYVTVDTPRQDEIVVLFGLKKENLKFKKFSSQHVVENLFDLSF
jgi:hypothetical protein